MSSASRSSSTTMARRPIARAPAAPARTSTTRAGRRAHRHSALCARLRETASGVGDRPFAESYAPGETPVPCIECNRSIKFRDLLDDRAGARRAGARDRPLCRGASSADGSRALYCAADADRDQSYFLFATTREQLDYLRFPLGDMTKPEVRELARRFGLTVADKHDSQDICFVPTGRYTDIIERLKPDAVEPGEIVDLDGRVLGSHHGIAHFTVGQREGSASPPAQPLYVVRLDAATRRVVVGPREALRTDRLRCATSTGSATARSIAPSASGLEIFVRVRSTRAAAAGLAARRRRPLRSRARRGRGGRLARTGLRVLRRAPRARRACSAAASSRAPRQHASRAGDAAARARRVRG